MRFSLIDRIVELEPGKRIKAVKALRSPRSTWTTIFRYFQ
jgi:hypothetical protein